MVNYRKVKDKKVLGKKVQVNKSVVKMPEA